MRCIALVLALAFVACKGESPTEQEPPAEQEPAPEPFRLAMHGPDTVRGYVDRWDNLNCHALFSLVTRGGTEADTAFVDTVFYQFNGEVHGYVAQANDWGRTAFVPGDSAAYDPWPGHKPGPFDYTLVQKYRVRTRRDSASHTLHCR